MEKILNFNSFLKESDSGESEIQVNSDLIERIVKDSTILSALKGSNYLIGINPLSDITKKDGLLISIESRIPLDFITRLKNEEILISPSWFGRGRSECKLVFYQSENLKQGEYEVDAWYATSGESFLSLHSKKPRWESSNKEFVVEYNADSENSLLNIIDRSIREIVDVIKKVRVSVHPEDWPKEMVDPLKNFIKSSYQKSVDQFFLEGSSQLFIHYSDVENILIDLFNQVPGSVDSFSDLPEKLRDKIVDSEYLESLPSTESLKSLKAQNKAKKLMKYI